MAHSTVSSTVTVTVCLHACTGLLVQHSMTVITINSSLTQCTVGAVQYHVNAQQSILLHTVRYQNKKTYATLNKLSHNQQ